MSKSIFINSILTKKTLFDHLTEDMGSGEFPLIKKLLETPLVGYVQTTINEYYLGNFDKLLTLLPKEKLEDLMRVLHSYKKNAKKFPIYEKMRSLLKLYLEGLIKCVTQYLELLNLKSQLDHCEERCGILDDIKKLQEYIEELQRGMRIFNPPPQNVVCAVVKQEHATYLRMYGYPVGGIFDVEKLNNIILNQNEKAENVMN